MQRVLSFNRSAIEDRIVRAAAYLGIEGGFEGFHAFVGELNAAIGIPASLSEMGVSDPDVQQLVSDALEDPSCGGNPVEMTRENTEALYRDLLGSS
ncbi:MAG: iron-containing alcohol dehydrogenase, partial [Pseudomonadota bacterium]